VQYLLKGAERESGSVSNCFDAADEAICCAEATLTGAQIEWDQ
jgi:hypothetical protein